MALAPNAKQRLAGLIARGYFPEELPLAFTTEKFASALPALEQAWTATPLVKFVSEAETFSIPRAGHERRIVSIVNPLSQLIVSRIIADEWSTIKRHVSKSGISEFVPVIDIAGPRPVLPPNFVEINRRRARLRARFNRVLQTDAQRFYPSIYTHTIPWALHGKSWVKSNLNTPALSQKVGDKLDRAVRNGQGKQSVGIPIGPDTSRVIAEIIAVSVDKLLFPHKTRARRQALRYVDDYLIGLDDQTPEDRAVAKVRAAFQQFELSFNPQKTHVDRMGEIERPAWRRAVKSFRFNSSRAEDSIRDYFDELLTLFSVDQSPSMLVYAIKRSRSFHISSDEAPYYVDRLLHIARAVPDTLPTIVQAILDIHSRHPLTEKEELLAFVVDNVSSRSDLGHTYEVTWALYLARGLGLKIRERHLAPVYRLESSTCALICMDLEKRGQVTGSLDQSAWKAYANVGALQGPMWLLAYEADKKGWWQGGVAPYVTTHPYFAALHAADVEFYDQSRNVYTTQVELRRLQIFRARLRRIFDSPDTYS